MLPPHTTHVTQPLDVGLFGPLAHYYSKEVDDYIRWGNQSLAREDFEGLLARARDKAYTKRTIKRAWVKAGLVPLDLEVLLKIKRPDSTISERVSLEDLPKTTSQLKDKIY